MSPVFLIVDANVLIDFCSADRTLLSLVDRHVGRVLVASPVLAKVDQLTEEDVAALGLELVHPETEEAAEAAVRTRGHPLAFDDWICLLMARARAWTCVTNDKRLRKECDNAGVPVRWGLEPIVGLVGVGKLSVKEADEAAMAIHRANPRFVTADIVAVFRSKVRALKKPR